MFVCHLPNGIEPINFWLGVEWLPLSVSIELLNCGKWWPFWSASSSNDDSDGYSNVDVSVSSNLILNCKIKEKENKL